VITAAQSTTFANFSPTSPLAAARVTLKLLAERWTALSTELTQLDAQTRTADRRGGTGPADHSWGYGQIPPPPSGSLPVTTLTGWLPRLPSWRSVALVPSTPPPDANTATASTAAAIAMRTVPCG
jgi:hypothetical protein